MYPITSYSWPNTTKTWHTQIYNENICSKQIIKLRLKYCERSSDRIRERNWQLCKLMDIFVNKLCILVTKNVSPLGIYDSINASVNQQTNYIAIINMLSESHRGNQEVSEESVHDWLLIQNQHHRHCGSYDHEAGNCAIWILTIHGKMSTFHFCVN